MTLVLPAGVVATAAPLIEAEDVTKHFVTGGGLFAQRTVIRAVDEVSLAVGRGETVALVGESGSGKSTFGRALLWLDPPTSGAVRFLGRSLGTLGRAALRDLRRRMQIVFQDPYGSLDPRMTVGDSIAEGMLIHRLCPRAEAMRRVEALLDEVGLEPEYASRYPREFSGGQRQRIGIARALAVEPEFLVLDEPVSALDVSVQAQVLTLLESLRTDRELSYLLIAHDLAVVRQVATRVAVMYLGRIVEEAPTETLVSTPRHPYTVALLSAAPSPDPDARPARIVLPGEPPSPAAPPAGCVFHPRCFHPARSERCQRERPLARPVGGTLVACHYAEEPAVMPGSRPPSPPAPADSSRPD